MVELEEPIRRETAHDRKLVIYVVVCVLFGFLLLSAVLVDYVYCCSVSCNEFDSLTAPLWSYYFNLVNPFLSSVARSGFYLGPLSQLSTQALVWLAALGVSFAQVRRRKVKSTRAMFDSVLFLASIVFLFEVGLFIICPTWRSVHVTNLQNNTVFAFFNNSDLLISSAFIIVILQIARAFTPKYQSNRGTRFSWRIF
jgi:hypothetical protein